MNLKFWKGREKKSDIVQFQGGIYYLGSSSISQLKLKNYLQAYKINDAVYSCIKLLSGSAAGIPWYVYREQGEKIIEVSNHPLVDFKNRPAKNLSWPKFIEKAYSYYLVSGNLYIRKLIGSLKSYGEIELLRPDKVRIETNVLGISHYEYNLQGRIIPLKPEEVLHLKTFNPEDDLYGLSPIDTIARMVDIATLNQSWIISFLENEAMIGGKIISKGSMTEHQKGAIKKHLEVDYGGVLNAGKWLVLEGDMDAKRFESALKDLDTTPLENLVLRKICSVFKVPSELLGDSENKTYSNQKEARKSLYQETILPFMNFFRDELNIWIVPDFDPSKNLYLDYDTSDTLALSEDLDKLWERAVKATGGVPFLDRNEAREMLKYGNRQGLSIVTVPINQIPIEGSDKAKPKGLLMKSDDTKVSFWQKKENKKRLWEHFVKRVEMKEKTLIDPIEKYLKAQAIEVKKKVSKFKQIEDLKAKDVFDEGEEAKAFAKEFLPHYSEHFLAAGEAGLQATVGKLMDLDKKTKEEDFIITPELRKKLERLILESGAEISKTTLKKIERQIELALEKAWTIEELTQNIEGKLDGLSISRSRLISRTEMAKVENWGQVEGYKQSEFVELKGWLCSFVPDSRESHMAADAEYSDNPIPLDEPFKVNNEPLDYPGDPSGSPGNVINCLCSTYPEVGKV